MKFLIQSIKKSSTFKVSFILLIFLLGFSCSKKQEGYTINGQIKGISSASIGLLEYIGDDLKMIDSTKSVNGEFKFSGKLRYPTRYFIKIDQNPKLISFFIENSDINIQADISDLSKSVVTGSFTEEKYKEFKKEIKVNFTDKIDSLSPKFNLADQTGDEEMYQQLRNAHKAITAKEKEYIIDFAKKNNKSIISPFVMFFYIPGEYSLEDLQSVYKNLDPSLAETPAYKYLKSKVESLEKIQIGKESTDFIMNDTTGTPISLFSLRTKYVLIDFWSSKCNPCRKENPKLIKVYNEFKNKGFEILGVSFDNKREEWIEAIKTDKINWLQVSQLTGWDNKARDIYQIEYIPQNILLSPEGIILEKNLSSDDLKQRLSKLLNK
jgi:thiol-disulfide isomerase/thioredoxin